MPSISLWDRAARGYKVDEVGTEMRSEKRQISSIHGREEDNEKEDARGSNACVGGLQPDDLMDVSYSKAKQAMRWAFN